MVAVSTEDVSFAADETVEIKFTDTPQIDPLYYLLFLLM